MDILRIKCPCTALWHWPRLLGREEVWCNSLRNFGWIGPSLESKSFQPRGSQRWCNHTLLSLENIQYLIRSIYNWGGMVPFHTFATSCLMLFNAFASKPGTSSEPRLNFEHKTQPPRSTLSGNVARCSSTLRHAVVSGGFGGCFTFPGLKSHHKQNKTWMVGGLQLTKFCSTVLYLDIQIYYFGLRFMIYRSFILMHVQGLRITNPKNPRLQEFLFPQAICQITIAQVTLLQRCLPKATNATVKPREIWWVHWKW